MSEKRASLPSRADPDGLAGAAGLPPPGSPVLLLHGFFATRRSLHALERRLVRDGFRAFSVELGGLAGRFNTRRIDELARLVRDEVERIYARHPGMAPLTVIGHSKGGLIAAWWVKRLDGHRRVRTVVTLGTPHRGTPLAWAAMPFAWLAPSVAQMRPGSGFMRRLHEGSWPARVQLLAMYSRRDRIVPHRAAVIDERGAEARNVEVDAAHGDFLLEKRIYATLLSELRGIGGGEEPSGPSLRAA
ncbi:MAG TPA: alpha/beta fold hydrolase [Anaeromyxobacter sp.]